MALAVAEKKRAGFSQGHAMADRGHRVLQYAHAARVHVRIAAGHRRHRQACRQRKQFLQTLRIVPIAVQFNRQVSTRAEGIAHPGALPRFGISARQPQGEEPGHAVDTGMRFEVLARDQVFAFRGGAPRLRDQSAQVRIAFLRLHQQHQAQTVVQFEFAADDQPDAGDFRRHQCTHDAGERALVGDRQRLVTALRCAGE
jgi:hypothetical protein